MSGRREELLAEFFQAGRESSRLSVMYRSAIAGAMGLTVTDMECLDFLIQAGQATAGQLAQYTHLTTGAVTGMVRRMERAGYVTSERDAVDRRKVIVKPVPEKLAAATKMYESYGAHADELMSQYSEEEVILLTRHYERMSAIYMTEVKKIVGNRGIEGLRP